MPTAHFFELMRGRVGGRPSAPLQPPDAPDAYHAPPKHPSPAPRRSHPFGEHQSTLKCVTCVAEDTVSNKGREQPLNGNARAGTSERGASESHECGAHLRISCPASGAVSIESDGLKPRVM